MYSYLEMATMCLEFSTRLIPREVSVCVASKFTIIFGPQVNTEEQLHGNWISLVATMMMSSLTKWNIFHHPFLDEDTTMIIKEHADRLLRASGSLHEWNASDFKEAIQFCDSATLHSARSLWSCYAAVDLKDHVRCRADLLPTSWEAPHPAESSSKSGLHYLTARSAAPCGMQLLRDSGLKAAVDQWLEVEPMRSAAEGAKMPNPLYVAAPGRAAKDLATIVSKIRPPILSYHLSTVVAPLSELSPLRLAETEDEAPLASKILASARIQLDEWTKAFAVMATAGRLVLRFIAADYSALCQTLQHCIRTGETCAGFYRRQFSADRLQLDPEAYPDRLSPMMFDTIETSSLANDLGVLYIVCSASPLLKDVPWAALHTESMSKSLADDTNAFNHLLCGPSKSIMTLLGWSPVEYWTNATSCSPLDEYMLAAAAAEDGPMSMGLRRNLTWKANSHLSEAVRPDLRVTETDLVSLLQAIYNEQHSRAVYRSRTVAAVLKQLQGFFEFNSAPVCRTLLDKIQDPLLGSQLFIRGLYHQPPRAGHDKSLGTMTQALSVDADKSNAISITIQIPLHKWTPICKALYASGLALLTEVLLSQSSTDQPDWMSSDVQIMFGTAEARGERNSPEYSIMVTQDEFENIDSSSLIVTCSVPEHLLREGSADKVLSVRFSDEAKFISSFQFSLTQPESDQNLFVTTYPPGQVGNAIFTPLRREVRRCGANPSCATFFKVNLDETSQVKSITGHLDVLDAAGKMLLADKAIVKVRQISPFAFELIIGGQSTYQMVFHVPVVKDGSKTRVARNSAYLELIVPLANPATAQALIDFVFPTVLAKPTSIVGISQNTPTALNIAHLNLDALPILNVSQSDRLSFLTTLTSSIFSARERKLREQILESDKAGLAASPRMNFKETLFTMFMLASGLQGGQTGLFAISQPERGGIHMLILISALRLDSACASVALDGCVIPFTVELVKSGRLDTFLLILRTLECCTITVDDAELVLWKKVLPALTERCRTWTHSVACEYALSDAMVPLSVKPGEQVLCSCGAGKLPEDFINLPEWQETAAQYATRLAISPLFSVPYVEPVFDPDLLKQAVKAMTTEATPLRLCRHCGALDAKDGGPLKKCLRCLWARYCSTDCQKKDWKKHRMECEESEEYAGL